MLSNWRYWAWFDVHRAGLWQMVAASGVVAVFTLIVVLVMLAL